MANTPRRYRPDAVPTPLGWAHEKTGEQLTSARNLEPADGTEDYRPNSRNWMGAYQTENMATNTVAPVISGSAVVGGTLTATNGTWTGTPTPTFTRQWKKAGVNIDGATGTTYVTVSGDIGAAITCEVTGTNTGGSDSAVSNAITVTAS